MHLSKLLRLLTAATLAITFVGCAGYQLGAVKPARLAHIDAIAIPTAKNETLEPRISTNVTNAVIKAFHNDGTFKITTGENADAVLHLTIFDIEKRQLRSARFNTLRSRELAVRLKLHYELIDSGTGNRLYRGRLRHETNVFLSPNQQLSERQAIADVSRKAAADLVSRVAEGWPGEEDLVDPATEERLRVLRARAEDSRGDDETLDD